VLYHLFLPLEHAVSGFRLIRYISFRAAFAAILAFLVATVVGPGIVRTLRARKIAGTALTSNDKVDATRISKRDVPTMGGVILLVGVTLSALLFARLDVAWTWIAVLSFLAFGALGARDDWKKLTVPGSRGMSERGKLLGQLAISVLAIGALYAAGNAADGTPWLRGPTLERPPYVDPKHRRHEVLEGETLAAIALAEYGDAAHAAEIASANGLSSEAGAPPIEPAPGRTLDLPVGLRDPADHHRADLQLPFSKSFCLDLGLLLLPFAILVIVGASNAVNLTDGLDGLAIGCTAAVATTLTVAAYLAGRADFSRDLHLFHVPEAGELAVIGAALVGGSLGFLWFNAFPAQVFMGDTGSLAIGGILGILAVAIRHEATLFLAGLVFVAEALSVIWQRLWFKGTRRAAAKRGDPQPTGKRWFRCAPLHHHYEQGGLHENKVTVRLWIVSVVCALFALATLKVR
jgi:phospho-N-acetylmuramoyl-pentapeptide-transferase